MSEDKETAATPGQAAYEARRAEFLRFLASQGYDDQGRFDHDEMELAFETGWQIGQVAPAAQPADAAISAWIENYPREFATWLATQRHVGGVTPESVAIAAQDARPALAAEEARRALAAALLRAEAAEASLAGLEARIGQVIAAVVKAEGERADTAKAKLEGVREVIGNFLGQYGHSDIPMFKVAQDLAASLLKVIDGPAEEAFDA